MKTHYLRIVRGIDWGQPWYSFLYSGALLAGTIVLAVFADWEVAADSWPSVGLFVGLGAVSEILYVELPLGKGRVSVSFAIVLGALLLFDPPSAALVAAGGAVIANIIQALPLDVVAFNGSQFWLAAYTTAAFWQSLRSSDSLLSITPSDLFLLLICSLLYFALNSALVTVGIAFAHRIRMRELVSKNMLWALPNHLALGSLGFLIAILYLNVGIYGVFLLWIPLLLARYSFQQYIDIRAAHLETIQALAEALDAKDPYTRGHSDRVSQYTVAIAREMKLPESETEMLRYAGILHDIGKIGISDTVLNKVGRLTDEEFELVKSHSKIGAHMVRPVGFLRGVSEVIRHHHERYDGRGYPDGLKGEEIPIGARIMAVADAFDAMTYDRVYRAGMDTDRAVDQLIQGRGAQFDPDVVDVFVNRVLPEQIKLTQDATAKRRKGEPGGEGDRLWRTLIEDGEGEVAAGEDAGAESNASGKTIVKAVTKDDDEKQPGRSRAPGGQTGS